jgi:DNA-directed RNA polymerase specialized sigma subunit
MQQPNNYFYKTSKYLNNVQWKHINLILNNESSSIELKQKVKNIIYNYYEDWAFSKVYYIKKKYAYICRHIQVDELKLYAYIGLRKAIINYEYNIIYDFSKYASSYVFNEILNGISELLPIYLHYEQQKHIHRYYKNIKKLIRHKNQNKK